MLESDPQIPTRIESISRYLRDTSRVLCHGDAQTLHEYHLWHQEFKKAIIEHVNQVLTSRGVPSGEYPAAFVYLTTSILLALDRKGVMFPV